MPVLPIPVLLQRLLPTGAFLFLVNNDAGTVTLLPFSMIAIDGADDFYELAEISTVFDGHAVQVAAYSRATSHYLYSIQLLNDGCQGCKVCL